MRTLVVAALATAVVPPAGAWWLNARREGLTADRVRAAAANMDPAIKDQVWCGPGRLPDPAAAGAGAAHAEWITDAVVDASRVGGRQADAWGHCLLVGRGWVISAGANGVIETPQGAGSVQGDDIGARWQ